VKDLPERPICPRCGSGRLGVLRRGEDQVLSLVEKKDEKLTKTEEKIKEWAVKTAGMVDRFGLPAVVALCGRRLKTADVEAVLKKEKVLSDKFFELVIEAERNALKRRFW